MNKPQLMIGFETHEQVTNYAAACDGADGLVLAGALLAGPLPGAFEHHPWVVTSRAPETLQAWHGRSGTLWTSTGDLESLARLRERLPDLAWLPRADVCRPAVQYSMMRSLHGSGFTYYAPDPATLRGLHVAGGTPMSVTRWLARAEELGFEEVWLHGQDAEAAGRGLELDLIERAHGNFHGGLWLSGGIAQSGHLANLVHAGGCTCVVVPSSFINHASCAAMQAALSGPVNTGSWAAQRDRRLVQDA